MLHLAAGIGLGVDVGDLLELERPFEGDGKLTQRPRIEEVGAGEEPAARSSIAAAPARIRSILCGMRWSSWMNAELVVVAERAAGLAEGTGR